MNDQEFNPKKAFSLDQLIYLFASIREPHQDFDTYYTNENMSTFMVVYKNNVAYKLEVIRNDKVISIDEIYSNILSITEEIKEKEVGFNFISGVTDRNVGETILADLTKNKINQASYQDIKDAIVILCYDDLFSKTTRDIFKNQLSAPNFNRFHGKGLLITFENKKNVVMCADHTKVDGGTEIYLMNRIAQTFDSNPNLIPSNKQTTYQEIPFELNESQEDTLNKIYMHYLK